MLEIQPRLAGKSHEGGWYPLHVAALSGDVELVKLVLARPKVDVNAIYKPSTEEQKTISPVDRQLELGTRVDDTSGATPLHYACMTGNIDVIKLLVENGAAFKAKDDKKRKPIDYFDIKEQSEALVAFKNLYTGWKKRHESFKGMISTPCSYDS